MTATVIDQVEAYDWSAVEGTAVRRLRGKKIRPVPAPLIRQVQLSYEGVPVIDEQTGEALRNSDGSVYLEHSLRYRFESPERAARAAGYLRDAGVHTVPQTTVSVKIDPDRLRPRGEPPGPVVDECLVEWKAGIRKGRKS